MKFTEVDTIKLDSKTKTALYKQRMVPVYREPRGKNDYCNSVIYSFVLPFFSLFLLEMNGAGLSQAPLSISSRIYINLQPSYSLQYFSTLQAFNLCALTTPQMQKNFNDINLLTENQST